MSPFNEHAGTSIYQLKVTLSDTEPPIWRRIQVKGDATFADLHLILQVAMGWENYHLHQFIVRGVSYGPSGKGLSVKNDKTVTLCHLAPDAGESFIYQYDFGDNWDHIAFVEQILPAEAGQIYPVCLAGQGACPPEDVGGPWGYYSFLEAILNPDHPEHEDMVEWIERDFDPDYFNLDEVNKMLRRVR
jgi:hypothetical protein